VTNLGSEMEPGLPTLAAVRDPAQLARHLAGVIHWDSSAQIRIDVLRWKKADRCTLEIALKPVAFEDDFVAFSLLGAAALEPKTDSGWRELIGKVFAEDRTDIYDMMEELRRAGFEPHAEFGIPRAIAFIPSLRLLLYDKVPGVRARKLIAKSRGTDAAVAAQRSARWLARFHARGPHSGQRFELKEQLRTLEEARRGVTLHGSAFGEKSDRLLEQLRAAAPQLAGSEMELRASHGTYSPGQVLLADERTVVIDFDDYQVADPAIDVAWFLIELKRMGLKYTGSTDGFQPVGDIFLATYVAAADTDVMRRLAFQKAAICLERAKHDVDKQEKPWRERAGAMLDEGLRALAEEE
jgi:aminoglycoside phosphotransferase (APT) family kinase protein